MKPILSYEFNMDASCVELKFLDGTILAIDTIAVEDEVAANMFERSELDYLIYNDPVGYAELILNGDPEAYLRQVTDYRPLDNCTRMGGGAGWHRRPLRNNHST